jgi:hypothetical protein
VHPSPYHEPGEEQQQYGHDEQRATRAVEHVIAHRVGHRIDLPAQYRGQVADHQQRTAK